MVLVVCSLCGGMSRLVGMSFLCPTILLVCRILVVYQFTRMKEELLVEVEDMKVIVDSTPLAKDKPFVVVGIPAFNEEHSVARVVLGAQKFADAVGVCEDGSSDMPSEIAKRLGADVVKK